MTRTLRCGLGVALILGLGAVVPVLADNDPFGLDEETVHENADFNFDELSGKLSLRFYDAVSGAPIPGARVTLRGKESITDSSGKAIFPFPRQKREEGWEEAVFEKKGYISSRIRIHVLLDSVFLHRYSISPALPPGRYRFVLDWTSKPPDLDVHLVKQGRYHISFRDMRKFEDRAWLDRDDVDGEGPETITVARLEPEAHYTFFVHDYTHRQDGSFRDFGKSRARVLVFNDRELVQAFEVPDGAGRFWKVCEIRDAQIVPVNRIEDGP
ncbi:MAG: hypothetical protein JXR96_14250 [Deltaproteobacteria bacterium]|nr:hypothetical protein [Deltaproteobacteria bacterium]